MRYLCHRQSWRTAYRLQARLASTGPDLQLTGIRSSGLPFNGRHPRNHESLLIYRPRRDGRLIGLVGWPI